VTSKGIRKRSSNSLRYREVEPNTTFRGFELGALADG